MVSSPQTTKSTKDAPPNFSELTTAIQKSRRMLAWEADWDGEGSPGYAESTWQRAADFLTHAALQLWQDYGESADVPRITPGPNASIDVVWRANEHKLLLNVPANANELATYYGENRDHETIEGALNTSLTNHWLLLWMMK